MHSIKAPLNEITTVIDHIHATQKKFLLLTGSLGAGKTTLLKQRVESLWWDSSEVTSPTYTYLNSYHEKILHIDMRRIESAEQLHELGILDAIDNHEYVAIEWPKRTEQYSDDSWLSITIEKEDESTRKYLFGK